jgi:hypothetical protein
LVRQMVGYEAGFSFLFMRAQYSGPGPATAVLVRRAEKRRPRLAAANLEIEGVFIVSLDWRVSVT